MSNGKETIETARDLADENQDDLLEVEGYTIRIKAIPIAIITDVTAKIPEPDIPVWHNEEHNRDEQNPNDPAYLKAKDEVDRKRGEAMIDATVMFGIDVVGGIPPTDEWLPKLRFIEKRGQIDLSSFDLEEPLEVEFVFKRYIIANIALINYIQEMSAVKPEDIGRAGRPFRRSQKR